MVCCDAQARERVPKTGDGLVVVQAIRSNQKKTFFSSVVSRSSRQKPFSVFCSFPTTELTFWIAESTKTSLP
jgi:hypothetical protein